MLGIKFEKLLDEKVREFVSQINFSQTHRCLMQWLSSNVLYLTFFFGQVGKCIFANYSDSVMLCLETKKKNYNNYYNIFLANKQKSQKIQSPTIYCTSLQLSSNLANATKSFSSIFSSPKNSTALSKTSRDFTKC